MSQFNLNITEEFSQDLARYMKARGIGQKSEAIRTAVKEALEISHYRQPSTDFRAWLGLGNQGRKNPRRKFFSEGDLWGDS